MNWFLLACWAALLPSFAIGSDFLTRKNDTIRSIDCIRRMFLQLRETEVRQLENILIYQILLAMEVAREYEYREQIRPPDIRLLGYMTHMETKYPLYLKFFHSDFQSAAQREYTRFETYLSTDRDRPAISRETSEKEENSFAFRSYAEWVRAHPDKEAEKKAIKLLPFLTTVTVRINKLLSEPFKWSDKVTFFTSDKTSTEAVVLRNIGTYEYAEFNYPNEKNCAAGALRLKVNEQLSMIFVIPLKQEDTRCNSSEVLLKILEDGHLETIRFEPRRMFISIPVIRTASVVFTTKHLQKLQYIRHTPYEFETIPSTSDRFLSMALIFDPVPPYGLIPRRIPTDIDRFHVDRPFLVAVLGENGSRVPFVLGLIQNPVTVS